MCEKCIYSNACLVLDMSHTISLSNNVYNILIKQKRFDESFSDLVLRMMNESKKKPLSTFAAKWKSDDIDDVFDEILKDRSKSFSREVFL